MSIASHQGRAVDGLLRMNFHGANYTTIRFLGYTLINNDNEHYLRQLWVENRFSEHKIRKVKTHKGQTGTQECQNR